MILIDEVIVVILFVWCSLLCSSRAGSWFGAYIFYFCAINIVTLSGDSNLGPKAFSPLEFEIASIPLGDHGRFYMSVIDM